MAEQTDNDLLGNELRRELGLLLLTKHELAKEKGWISKKVFVREAVRKLLDEYKD